MTHFQQAMILFRACFGDTRLAEFQAVAQRIHPHLQDISWSWQTHKMRSDGGDIGPHILQKLPKMENWSLSNWAMVTEQTVATRAVFALLAEGPNLTSCVEQMIGHGQNTLLQFVNGSWCFRFHMIGKDKLHPNCRLKRIEAFKEVLGCLSKYPVKLHEPDHEIWLIEDYKRPLGAPQNPNAQAKYFWLLKRLNPPSVPKPPTIKSLVNQLDVKKRAFISTTTMPANRSMVLANLALAGQHPATPTVLDPFCGSGSLLLACAALGAHTVGADIQTSILSSQKRCLPFPYSPHRPMRGKEAVSIYDNFTEHAFPPPKSLLAGLDSTTLAACRSFIKANDGLLYDAILCDLPYGKREYIQHQQSYKAQAKPKNLFSQLVETLIKQACYLLKSRGRLVFMIPIQCPRTPRAPTESALQVLLYTIGKKYGIQLHSLGSERVHHSLSRATVVMVKDQRYTQKPILSHEVYLSQTKLHKQVIE